MLVNALRAHMAEFGIIAPQGLRHVEILTKTISHEQERIRELAPGGKERLGQTSKRGDKYIRSLLTADAVAMVRHAHNRPTRDGE